MKRYLPLTLLVLLAVVVSACNSPLLPSFLRGQKPTPVVRATAPRALPTAKTAGAQAATTPAAGVAATAAPAGMATIVPTGTLSVNPGGVITPTITAGGAITSTTAVEGGAGACTDQARMVRDVTIPDNTVVGKGQGFVKTWRLRNSGTCTWDTTYAIVFASGEQMGARDSIVLPSVVPPGGALDVSVDFTAPDKAGTYKSSWKMRNAEGKDFGISPSPDGTFWLQIVVR